jgi:putative ABC transport system permease protein
VGSAAHTRASTWPFFQCNPSASIGEVIGVILANLVSVGLAHLSQIPLIFNLRINLGSFVFSGLIGIVFGYFPALRAARLDPIEALRDE